jgi:hypothetical protein
MVHEVSDYIVKKYTMSNRSDRLLKMGAFREIFSHSYEKGNQEIIRGTNSVIGITWWISIENNLYFKIAIEIN